MTNEEKYKTAEERKREFYAFCSTHICAFCKCNMDVIDQPKEKTKCAFRWLTLEYEDELKPCPFCGSEASINSGTEDHYVVCRNDDCAAALIARSFSSAEEAIAAWNRRV
jgi:Lar family restriction alleviation protein